MFFEKLVSVLVVLFGIFLYTVGVTLDIHSLLFDCAAGADVITGLVLLDGLWKGWLL
ncbi:hypothetical protein [Weissella soli]|jgi:hypothetical protein|uniref:Uncharacterized protein n=1 Tax=Weissella soli TaxID=155866 RepID=A0A288Q6F3_9LACO|nr:hypothetical protein [Weissella soli]AOT56589.1 hypothetical protein WSWS_00958 [Weissella soli]NKY83041.1 hypothetical protein [Weissella soli]RDL12154.1 hypothetical protein DFP99_0587 [Weissella soli]GEN92609.1 hypothetical protein WSO01_02210 [Weissella soli]